jgi:hypothetical protein
LKEYLETLKQNQMVEFLKKKPYKSDECCICLNDLPNIIFYQCGHQCVHQECGNDLDKCPLCRKKVSAKLNILRATA